MARFNPLMVRPLCPTMASFDQVSNASFMVFDRKRGLELLGPNPTYEYVFDVNGTVHEAPVYVPAQNKLFLSQLALSFAACSFFRSLLLLQVTCPNWSLISTKTLLHWLSSCPIHQSMHPLVAHFTTGLCTGEHREGIPALVVPNRGQESEHSIRLRTRLPLY